MTTTTAAPAGHTLEDLRVPTVPVAGRDTSPPAHRTARDVTPAREARAPWVAFACYAAAAASLLVSTNTSWRFFDRVLHIPTDYGERYLMFAVAEVALVVCGAGMAVNVHRDGRPGSFRVMVWAMVIAMGYMAWAMSTPEEAIGRILLGPALGTIMLHLGLGLELRARHQRTGTIARIGRELRERCLSRLGLADDGRDAAQRTRDRKACKAAALSRPRRLPWSRQARLEHALLAAGVADDPAMRDRMLARLAVVRHADALSTLTPPSPWQQADSDIRPGAQPAFDTDRAAHYPAPRAAGGPAPRTSAPPRSNDPDRTINGSEMMCGAGEQAGRAATSDLSAARPARTLTAVPDSAVSRNGNRPLHTGPRAEPGAQPSSGDDAARRATPSRDIDPAAIQHWLPVAKTIVGDGVTRGRMRRWPEEQHPEVVATVLADHAAGTPPSTIGRRRDVHHQTVGKILEAAGALTG
jgi:hypothetical protein